MLRIGVAKNLPSELAVKKLRDDVNCLTAEKERMEIGRSQWMRLFYWIPSFFIKIEKQREKKKAVSSANAIAGTDFL